MQRSSSAQSQQLVEPSTNQPATSPQSLRIFYLLFFLSGMCALIYEIVWTRRLTLIFGVTVYSISTVLVAYMGGLACGSLWFGRLVDQRKDPVRLYGWLEIGIGLSALLLPLALAGLNPAYRFVYHKTGASVYVMSLVKFLLSVAVLLVPTTLMGATLPVLTKFIVRRSDRSGAGIGSLYAVNTFGAVTGCFLAGFVLLGQIGMTGSERLAAFLNIFVGLIALALHRWSAQTGPGPMESPTQPHVPTEAVYTAGTRTLVLLIFGLSGMAALAYEVLWSRILVFLLGSSIYSFSMILVVYLLGITGGSLIFSRFADRLRYPLRAFGWLEVVLGLTVIGGLILFRQLPFVPYSLKVEPLGFLLPNLLSTFAVVLPPTLLMGAIFPVVVRMYARNLGAIGKQTGTLYAVNTLGAIVGSFIAGFVLIPLLGSKDSVLLLVLLSMTCGLLLLRASRKEEGSRSQEWIAAGLLFLPLAGFPFGNNLMKDLSVTMLERRTERNWEVLAFDEDATAAVAVAEDAEGTRLLITNGVSMTYLGVDTQLMAHLPLAIMQNPRKVLVVCFGMGTTFVSAKSAGMETDFVELCPYVVEAFKYYHDDSSVLEEPGVGKIIADGRNYLLLSDKSYDLITIDPPPPPYSAGTVNLYTREFYQLCKSRLTPDGIVCQWIPMYSSSEDQYKMLLRTFLEVFPHTSVWSSVNKTGTYLIGTPERLQTDRDSFYAYFDNPAIRQDLALYDGRNVEGKRVLSLLLLDEAEVKRYVKDAPILTDDLPLIEFPLFRPESKGELMRIPMLERSY
ncbi:MAG: fused MFS/spermidine synthase [Candidatus Abyssubacteria bacterium]